MKSFSILSLVPKMIALAVAAIAFTFAAPSQADEHYGSFKKEYHSSKGGHNHGRGNSDRGYGRHRGHDHDHGHRHVETRSCGSHRHHHTHIWEGRGHRQYKCYGHN